MLMAMAMKTVLYCHATAATAVATIADTTPAASARSDCGGGRAVETTTRLVLPARAKREHALAGRSCCSNGGGGSNSRFPTMTTMMPMMTNDDDDNDEDYDDND